MAHRILGIDVGTSSIKLALIESSLRKTRLVAFQEFALSEMDRPSEVLSAVAATGRWKADMVVSAMSGTEAMVRYLSFPFADPRKIAPVVGYELEVQIPYEIDDVVFDHIILARSVQEGQVSSRVVVAAAPIEQARKVIEELGGAGFEPRILTVAPIAYSGMAGAEDGLSVVLDVGHRHTNIAVLSQGRPVLVRSIARGVGHLVDAVAARSGSEPGQVRQAVLSHGLMSGGPAGAAMDGWIAEAWRPWVLGIRQTVSAIRSELGASVERVLLCGGGSDLPGLSIRIADLFGLSRGAVSRVGAAETLGAGAKGALAVGLARLGADRHSDALNLRQGELALGSSHSLFREKSLVFATAAVVAFGLLVSIGWAKLSVVRKEEAALAKRLASETEEVLGKSVTDPEVALSKIRALRRKKRRAEVPIPQVSAFAILSEISKQTPPKDKVTLDVRKLEIKATKIRIDGTAGSASEVEQFAAALRKIKCFDKVEPGRTTEVGQGDEKKSEFTINVASNCM